MSVKPLKKIFLCFTLLAVGYCLSAIPSWAQELSLGISPPLLEILIKPSKSIMIAYKVDNYGDPVIAKARILPFEPFGNQGNIQIADEFSGPVRFSLDNSDIELDKPFFMKTRESKQLLLRIRLPENTPNQDYYYTLLIETEAPPNQDGLTSSKARGAIGANILITATGTGRTQIKGSISLFDFLKSNKWRIFDSNAKIPIVLNVKNDGKNMFQSEGEIILSGAMGLKTSYKIVPQNILAQSEKTLTATPSAEFDKPASLVLNGFFIGRYNLVAILSFGEGLEPLTASASFIAFPFRWLFGIVFAISLGALVIKRLSGEREEDEDQNH